MSVQGQNRPIGCTSALAPLASARPLSDAPRRANSDIDAVGDDRQHQFARSRNL